jgi:hypothetical protein
VNADSSVLTERLLVTLIAILDNQSLIIQSSFVWKYGKKRQCACC